MHESSSLTRRIPSSQNHRPRHQARNRSRPRVWVMRGNRPAPQHQPYRLRRWMSIYYYRLSPTSSELSGRSSRTRRPEGVLLTSFRSIPGSPATRPLSVSWHGRCTSASCSGSSEGSSTWFVVLLWCSGYLCEWPALMLVGMRSEWDVMQCSISVALWMSGTLEPSALVAFCCHSLFLV